MAQDTQVTRRGRPPSFPNGTEMHRITVPRGFGLRLRRVAAELDKSHGAVMDELLSTVERRIERDKANQVSPLHRPREPRPTPTIAGYT